MPEISNAALEHFFALKNENLKHTITAMNIDSVLNKMPQIERNYIHD